MKRVLIIGVLLGLILSPLLSAGGWEAFTFRSSWTLRELAEANGVPLGKLAPALKKDALKDAGTELNKLEVDRASARRAIEKYRQTESAFVQNIVMIGMLIVFCSLILVAVLIGLLRYLSFGEKKNKSDRKSIRSVVGTIRSSGDMSSYAIAAVVAAIFLHEEEVKQENRLLLTWKRTSTNMWKSARTMPNNAFQNSKGGWK